MSIDRNRLRSILASEGLIKTVLRDMTGKRASTRKVGKSMTTDELEKWLRNIKRGDTIDVYWKSFKGSGKVVRVNPNSVTVTLLETVENPTGGDWEKGRKINVPTDPGVGKWRDFENMAAPTGLSHIKRASTRKTAHRPHFVTPKELRDGHAFMTYKIDAGKNNSKFYEGKIAPADDGSWSLLKRWGALTDKGPDRSRVDGAKYDKHGLSESQAQSMLAKEKKKRLGPRGYADAMKSRPLGQYPVGLDRDVGFGWGTQSITQCVPALRDMSELIVTALAEVQDDDPQDFLRALEGLVALTADLPSSSMAKEIAKKMRPPVQRMKKNPRFIDDPNRTTKELMTLKRYIDRQTKECNI